MGKETAFESLETLPAHSVHCPACGKDFSARFGRFGHSNYTLIGCGDCANLLALSEFDPVVLYLDGKFQNREAELQGAISRALMHCPCSGLFRIFDDRRRCPLCRAVLKEVQITGQVAGIGPEMRPVPAKLFSPGNQTWANLDFLRSEIESLARQYEASPGLREDGHPDERWLAKEIFDIHFRKLTPETLHELVPKRRDLFVFHNRVYHDHGGAKGPWWKFWDRELLYPERCGLVFDIDMKELKCSSCGKTFPARLR